MRTVCECGNPLPPGTSQNHGCERCEAIDRRRYKRDEERKGFGPNDYYPWPRWSEHPLKGRIPTDETDKW